MTRLLAYTWSASLIARRMSDMRSRVKGGLRGRLQLRLAATFALFGTLVSLLLSGGIFLAERQTSDRLMDETLRAELEDYQARRARNPASLPPATISIRGYVLGPGGEDANIPRQVLRSAARQVSVADRWHSLPN